MSLLYLQFQGYFVLALNIDLSFLQDNLKRDHSSVILNTVEICWTTIGKESIWKI